MQILVLSFLMPWGWRWGWGERGGGGSEAATLKIFRFERNDF